MVSSRTIKTGTVLMVALLIGSVAVAMGFQDDGNEEYRDLVNDLDKAKEAERIGKSSSSSIRNISNGYRSLVSGEDFENASKLDNLNRRIHNQLMMISVRENISADQVEDLRSDVIEMGDELGFESGFVFEYSSLIVLLFSISLSFLGTVALLKFLDWDRLKEAEDNVEKWREKIRESLGDRKKEKKLDREKEKWKGENNKIWIFSFKQAFVYLALFLVGLAWLSFVYGDWLVVWVPFNWITSSLTESIGIAFGCLGWFGISFFGFSFLFRSILISDES